MIHEGLPPELIEEIFDYLLQDKRALKVCSLVCKAWLGAAYRRLFYEVGGDSHRIAALYHPKSIAAPFIRRLRIRRCSSQFWNETFAPLDGFHLVTSLSLDNLPWDEMLPETKSTFSNRFITITHLEVRKVVTTAFSELAQLICTFRCLQSIILGATWQISDEPSPLLRLPQHLHTLTLNEFDMTDILDWFCSFGRDLTLRHVYFSSPTPYHCQAINTLLQALGPSLESFRLELPGVHCPVRLHHNTNLRFLSLVVWRRRESETGLPPILSGVTSTHIEEISLKIWQVRWFFEFAEPSYYLIPLEWGDVDGILARQEFSNLKSVSVCHGQDHDKPHPLEWFFDRLPLCHKRGLLRVYDSDVMEPIYFGTDC